LTLVALLLSFASELKLCAFASLVV
jgi:hypothetical protein